MNELVLFTGDTLPTLIDATGDQARMRFLGFFTTNVRNPNTRRAYAKACEEFPTWCSFVGVPSIADVQPIHVTTYSDANEIAVRVHDRMPVFLSEHNLSSWLDGSAGAELLRPAPQNLLQVWPVSKHVNRSADDNNDPALIERIALN